MLNVDGTADLQSARAATLLASRDVADGGGQSCNTCKEHRIVSCGLGALLLVDGVSALYLAASGKPANFVLYLTRLLLLGVCSPLAVKLGLGIWTCGKCCDRCTRSEQDAEEGSHNLSSSSLLNEDLEQRRASLATREANSWKRNLVLTLCFVGITAESTYTGIQVLVWSNETFYEAVCLTVIVACMNAEFLLVKHLVDRLTEEEGILLPGVHEHRLYYQKVAQFAWCKLCRERIGPKTGGPEGFKCKECDCSGSNAPTGGPHGGGSFWICLPCYRKHQSKSTQEGILRGDRGPKYVPQLTSWGYFLRAVSLCKQFRSVLNCAVLCTVITQVGRVLLPRFQGDIINALIDQQPEDFASMLLIFILISAGTLLFGSVQSVCVEIVQRRITCDMRSVMFDSLVKQDIAFFDGTMTGQLTSRMTNDVAAVVQPVRQILNTLLTNALRLAGGLFMCLFTSWKLTLLASTMIGPVVYLTGVYARWSKQINLSIRVNMADANAVATEALRNIRTVRSFGADQVEVGAFRRHMDQALRGGMKDAYASAGVTAITQYLDFAATILILWYGGYAVLSNSQSQLKIGHLVTFNLYWSMLNNSITGLNGILNTLVRAASAAQRVFEIIELEPDIPLDEGDLHLCPAEPCSVQFQGLVFAYPMRREKLVLEQLDFEIGAGQTVAIVGRSGAGKSTLVNLLLRFYDPLDGKVLINGRLLSDYNLRHFQKRVGVVSQDTQVFCRPISENLSYGLDAEKVNDESLVNAAQAANAHEFIQDLDDGYNSMIGEGGVRLSGGQRQRLAIARALLRQPSLLLLDEATSALDAENEGKVQQALDGLVRSVSSRCTVMLIAHRLSTVMDADKIVVLDGGMVAEQGTHDELLSNGQIYAGLVQRQIAKQANVVSETPSQAEENGEIQKKRGKGKGKGKNGASDHDRASAPADSIDRLFNEREK